MNARTPLNYAAAASTTGMPIIAGGQAAADVALPAAAPAIPMAGAAAPMAGAAAPGAATAQGAAHGGNSMVSGLPDILHTWSSYFEALAFLCFALALLWLLLWLLKKRGTGIMGGSNPIMRIESRLALGPKKWVIVTRYLDRRLVLGVTDENITLLSEIPLEEGGEAAAATKNNSSSIFASLLKGNKETPKETPSD